jgi:hypothetical protein
MMKPVPYIQQFIQVDHLGYGVHVLSNCWPAGLMTFYSYCLCWWLIRPKIPPGIASPRLNILMHCITLLFETILPNSKNNKCYWVSRTL